MKKLLFFLIVFISCKKDVPVVEITVTDITNGSVVQGATLALRRCANLGCIFGLVTEFEGKTDGNGKIKVPQEKYDKIPDWNDATHIDSPNFWSETFKKGSDFKITPAGWIRLRITGGAAYPPGSKLYINSWREKNPTNSPYLKAYHLEFNAATDSIIIIMGFGNQVNKIDWQVTDPSGSTIKSGSWNQQVPRMDTVKNITLNF